MPTTANWRSRISVALKGAPLLVQEGWREAPGWSLTHNRPRLTISLLLRPIGLARFARPSAPVLGGEPCDSKRFGKFFTRANCKHAQLIKSIRTNRSTESDRRSTFGEESVNNLFRDLKVAVRSLVSQPGFSIVAILTVTLGIGSAIAVFTVVNGVLIRSLPYDDPDRLVVAWGKVDKTNSHEQPLSWPDFQDYAAQNEVFESLAAMRVQHLRYQTRVNQTAFRDFALPQTSSLFLECSRYLAELSISKMVRKRQIVSP